MPRVGGAETEAAVNTAFHPFRQRAAASSRVRQDVDMVFWWSNIGDENMFMEITRRDDIGANLKAPVAARGGVRTPGYALVGAVRAGDVVVHYDSGAEQITGVSRATGEQYREPIWCAARGSYARKAGVELQWLPGLTVELEGLHRAAFSAPSIDNPRAP